MNDIDKDIDALEQKEDKDKPFVHKFFWFKMQSAHEYPDLLEYTALKLCNQAKCNLVEIVNEKPQNANKAEYVEYYIVAEGKKQKLMLLMELCKAWHIGIRYINDKQDRQLNKR